MSHDIAAQMVEGLRMLTRVMPLLEVVVEESGEHAVIGTDELMLDTVLGDLRTVYARSEVRVADPVTSLCETVVASSCVFPRTQTLNGASAVAFACDPLSAPVAAAAADGRLPLHGEDDGDAVRELLTTVWPRGVVGSVYVQSCHGSMWGVLALEWTLEVSFCHCGWLCSALDGTR